MVKKRPVIWDDVAKKSLKQAIAYIRADSPKNADLVKQTIKERISELSAHPERYPQDQLRIDNDGSFRYLTVFHFRISYSVGQDVIRIVRIRHTSQEPLAF